MVTSLYQGIEFTDADVCNPGGMDAAHDQKLWLIHDHGFTVAVVFATHEQGALDEAVDCGKMDRFLIHDADLADYGEEGDGVTYLGNASEPFDIESAGIIELPMPKMSVCALFNAMEK